MTDNTFISIRTEWADSVKCSPCFDHTYSAAAAGSLNPANHHNPRTKKKKLLSPVVGHQSKHPQLSGWGTCGIMVQNISLLFLLIRDISITLTGVEMAWTIF